MNEKEKEYLIRAIHGTQSAALCIIRALDLGPNPALWELADNLYWATRAAAKAAHDMGDTETGDYMDNLSDDLVAIAQEAGREIKKES